MEKFMKIGEISRLYHIGVDSLRYYEQIGLISPRRSEGGYRLYSYREIWRLNVIRDLRRLGFSMEAIGHYMEFQNVDTAQALLREEQNAIREKIRALKNLKKNVDKRLNTIEVAQGLPLDIIREKEFPPRNCYRMEQGYGDEREMDLLIKQLVNRSGDHLYIIGSNQIGSAISLESVLAGEQPVYRSVFAVDEAGTEQIPGGTFLCVCYRGSYSQSERWLQSLRACAHDRGLTPAGDVLELLWIDIHTTQEPGEYITELQMPVDP